MKAPRFRRRDGTFFSAFLVGGGDGSFFLRFFLAFPGLTAIMGASSFHFCLAASSSLPHISPSFLKVRFSFSLADRSGFSASISDLAASRFWALWYM